MINAIAKEASARCARIFREQIDLPILAEYRLRCISINTHRGRGPKLPYLLSNALPEERERFELLHQTRAYTYFIAEWLNRHKGDFDVVALQEVFNGILGVGDKILGKYRQRDHYRIVSGFRSFVEHGVGFAGFRYQNVLLSHLPQLSDGGWNSHLPGKVLFLASCGYTLAPFLLHDRIVWIGNTHLHAYNPKERQRQAARIADEIRKLGDVPIVFLGDLNTVPDGCRQSGFETGERDDKSYRDDCSLAALEDAGLRTVAHRDCPDFWSYPTGVPGRTLDYIYFSRHWNVRDYRVVTEFTFSDHYPVYADLELTRDRSDAPS